MTTLATWAQQVVDDPRHRRPAVHVPVAVADLGRHGTLGLGALAVTGTGTADGLVVFDRRCFRMLPDGAAAVADTADPVAFAVVSTFSPDLVVTVASVASVADLEARIAAVLPPRDFAVAVSVDGVFDEVRTEDGTTGTTVHRAVAGRLVGFRTPGPGGVRADLHLGFLDATRTRAGALAGFAGFSGRIELGFSTAPHLAVRALGAGFDDDLDVTRRDPV
ncbi:acetolactate decarboxylase [Curtobacterium flaccumfaciens pv. flaccumfaciens]|uniref:acetolactate decarboxylase n=1 Tax=Curtobacterium flaccumfaciens TaxID=2035 RepID=UPI0021B0A9BC|nr:acetolactate decarboxylase [Curtobacterium flaccumfaciens]QYI97089.1 acetolactate decarboxylase [Curtobacterium flaccumfaciens pv. flaccumfaciens]